MKEKNFLSKLVRVLMVIFIISPISLFGLNSKVDAAVEKPKEGKLIVHKFEFNGDVELPFIDGNGEELKENPYGATAKPGVDFNIIAIKDGELSNNPSQEEAQKYYDTYKDDDSVRKTSGVTNASGIYESEVLPAGRYLVFELTPETGATKASAPVALSIPMMNSEGTAWNNEIHVYTKDAVTLGAAKLHKIADDDTDLVGATFALYRKNAVAPDTLIKDKLITGNDGFTDVVGNLIVGDYYFIETAAPNNYLVSQIKVDFSVKKSNHAYDLEGKLIQANIIQPKFKNYLKPNVDKTLTTESSTDIGKTVSWLIKPDVPKNIEAYKKYVITDTLDKQLSYKGNLVVKADGVLVNPATYQLSEPTNLNPDLVLTFISNTYAYKKSITNVKNLEISFDTVINPTAIPGTAIPNNVILSMNNGSVDATSTKEVPPTVETGGRQFIKVNEDKNPLKGAEFKLYQTVKDKKVYLKQGDDKVVNWVDDSKEATIFTSPDNGKFEVVGLAYGTYFLDEIKAPKDYNLLTEDQKFTIDKDSYSEKAQLMIVNTTGPVIPVTGGIGTILFFVLGAAIMSVAFFFYRKQSHA